IWSSLEGDIASQARLRRKDMFSGRTVSLAPEIKILHEQITFLHSKHVYMLQILRFGKSQHPDSPKTIKKLTSKKSAEIPSGTPCAEHQNSSGIKI
ncbi:hypothetical protein, partial [Clostridioides difficile]|uniref:hypothetical protein n=1 Tax=Clostridioides difficile TaxID=1496 RepID=UPI002114F9BD